MAQEFCEFCAFTSRSPERVITETNNVLIVATLGQITEYGGYVLVIPKAHLPCLGELDSYAAEIFGQTVQEVIRAMRREYLLPVLMFEHGIVGQTVPHAHLHLIPAEECDPEWCIVRDFLNPRPSGSNPMMPVLSIEDLARTWSRSRQKRPYLFWFPPMSNIGRILWNPPAPQQYLRLVTAEILRRPSYGDWRKVHADPAKKAADWALIRDTVRRLKVHLD